MKKLNTPFRRDRRRKKEVPQQTEPGEQTLQQNKQLQETIRMMDSMKQQSVYRFHNQLLEFMRRNYVNKEEQSKYFNQQWEHKVQTTDREIIQIRTYQGNPEIGFYILTMVCFTFSIWLANVEFFFSQNQEIFIDGLVYIVPLFFFIFHFLTSKKIKKIRNQHSKIQIFYQISEPLLRIIYFIMKISESSICSSPYWLLFQLPNLYLLYEQASKIYKSFLMMSLSKKYEYHLKAFELIFTLVMVAHIIAIILFQLTKIEGEITWISKVNIKHKTTLVYYMYSFYFGCTTILTVGYGDIVPSNHIEVPIICLIQLFGTVIFAYLVSQIGYNLSNLRKEKEIVEKDLSILEKCRDYYKIEPQLLIKVKSNILNSKEAVNQLKPNQEHQLTQKLSQPLRQELVLHNRLSILKSSIFFLCRWSKHFQISVANSIISAIYMPGEQLFQPSGKERIYVVRLGQVDFYLKQRGNKREAQKVIKSLKVDLKTEVTDNSFGYTAVIGAKPTQLQAVSSDFTSAYYVNKQKFQEAINQNNVDKEYYHEIKDKIIAARFPEALELPILKDRKFHYTPSRSFLIRRQLDSRMKIKNERTDYVRRERKVDKKKLIKSVKWSKQQIQQLEQVRSALFDSLQSISLEEQGKQCSKWKPQGVRNNIVRETILSMTKNIPEENSIRLEFQFEEQAKNYSNFYPFKNINKVLERYERNCSTFQIEQEENKSQPKSKWSRFKTA